MSVKKRGKASYVKAVEGSANADMESLDVSRMSNAQLVKPPSAVKRSRATKASREALSIHEGTHGKGGSGTNRKDPKAVKRVEVDFARMPTREQRASNEYVRLPGERIDPRNKGEVLLVNLSSRARGAGVMFNRGQISRRELEAAVQLCALAERAQTSQLSAPLMGERVDGGKVDVDASRVRSAAAAHGLYRDALEKLSKCGRVLVENCVIHGMAMEEAVRLRTIATRLGVENSSKNRVAKAKVLVRDALDLLADVFHVAGD